MILWEKDPDKKKRDAVALLFLQMNLGYGLQILTMTSYSGWQHQIRFKKTLKDGAERWSGNEDFLSN